MQGFLAVAEELHFGRAAERLHMAQPPVSRMIQQLEREVGARLFDRSTRRVRLTAAGEALVGPAREILDAVRRAGATVAAAGRGEVGRVRVAYAGVSTHVIVGRLAKEVRRQHPGIQFELHSQNFAQPAMGKVIRGDMDLAMGRWDVVPAGIATRLLVRERLVLAMPASHPLAGADRIDMGQVAQEAFISLPPYTGAVLPDRLRRLSHAAGFEAEIVQISPDTWTAISMVAAEIGCTLTLSTVAENVYDPHVRFVPVVDDTPPILLRMAWREDDADAALAAVLHLSEIEFPSPGADIDAVEGDGHG